MEQVDSPTGWVDSDFDLSASDLNEVIDNKRKSLGKNK